MEWLFWCCLILMLVHYVFFPALIFAITSVFKRPHQIRPITPSVTLIISAYNEQAVIAAKLSNALESDYPRELLEIIVVSDGSSDQTPAIVRGFEDRGVRGLHENARRGKTHAMSRAVEVASGEIVVFSDANCFYRRDAIRQLVKHFACKRVGGVSGQKRIRDEQDRASSRGDKFYWNLESSLKFRESELGSVPTADGEIFAIRRALYPTLAPSVINDDMAITLSIVRRGLRVVYEPQAISEESASITLQDDFNVKARMVAGGYQILALLLRGGAPPWFTLQLFIHKGLRYFMPLLLIGIFIANAFLLDRVPYALFFAGQLIFYASALVGAALHRRSLPTSVLYLPLYYCAMNSAAFVGFYYFLRRSHGTAIWRRAAR